MIDKPGEPVVVEGRALAPFTTNQVRSLNAYQASDWFHPFTCLNRSDRDHQAGEARLYATVNGWRCARCDYEQSWAHDWMADWGWFDQFIWPE